MNALRTILLCIIALSPVGLRAQYAGGIGQGYSLVFVVNGITNCTADTFVVSGIYGGGTGDGYATVAAILNITCRPDSFVVSGIYGGGNDDGYSSVALIQNISCNADSFVVSGIYGGGIDDGYATASAIQSIPCDFDSFVVSGIYGGGINDGYAAVSAIINTSCDFDSFVVSGIYGGGIDDGYATASKITSGCAPPVLVEILQADTITACLNASFSLSGLATSGTPAYFYVWSAQSVNVVFNNIHGAATTGIVNTAGTYAIVLTATDQRSYAAADTVTLIITDLPATPGVITGTATACQGTSTTYTVRKVTGATGYTWSVNPSNAGTISSTDTAATITWGTVYSGNVTVTVVATNACGSSASSPNKIVTISPLPGTPTGPAGITSRCQGAGSSTFTSTATNATSYVWTITPAGAGTINSGGVVTWNAGYNGLATISVQGQNTCGLGPVSSIVDTINPTLVPAVSITAAPGNTICTGTSVTFTATPVNGGTAPVYVWKKNNLTVGSNSATYTDAALQSNDSITCTITSNAVCASPATAVSNTIKMLVTASIVPVVTVTISPNDTVCPGTPVTYTANAVGGGSTPAYQWRKNGVIVGSNSDTYANSTPANGDSVVVILTSSSGCASPVADTSAKVTLTISSTTAGSFSQSICQGQSYLFNGVNRTVAGAYLDTLVNAAGCDSILTLNLTVRNNTTGSFSQSICQGQSYFFNGVNRTVAGAYLDTLINAAGCDSILTLNLAVRNNTTGSFSQSICQGQSYLFNGINRTVAGAYLDTLVNAAGCDSILTLNLTVRNNSAGSFSQSICQGQFYLFNGINRTVAGTYLDTLANATGCDSILTLNLTVLQPTSGSISRSICPGQSYFFNGLNRTMAGAYLDTLINAAGCDSILTLNLSIYSIITTNLSESICSGGSYNFNGTPLSTAGIYRDTLSGINGCDSIIVLNLSINTFATGSINRSICQGQTYTFNGANLSIAGAYFDTLQAAGGCDSILTLNLTVLSHTAGSFSASICPGQSYLFNGVSRTIAGAYLDTLTNAAGCDSILTLNLTVPSNTTVSISESICQGQSYSFNGVNRTVAGVYFDTLVNAAGCDSILTLNLTIRNSTTGSISQSICQGQAYVFNGISQTTAGTYLDTLVNAAGCDSILTLNLSVTNFSTGSFSASICTGQSYLFNNQNLTIGGTYNDTLTASSGCDSIVTLALSVLSTSAGTISESICQGGSYTFNNQALAIGGTYRDTLVNAVGCDSILTLNLSVLSGTTATISETICTGSSYFFNNQNLTIAGTYLDTLVNAAGCDSIITLNLGVSNVTTGTTSATICTGTSYLFNGQNLTAAGTYNDTLTASAGCDSIVTLALTVLPVLTNAITQSICQGQSFEGYTVGGTYVDTFSTATGCDSIRTLTLTVTTALQNTIDTTVCFGETVLGYSVAGTYTDTFASSGGCDSVRTLNLTILPELSSSNNVSICQGESYFAGGADQTAGGTYFDTLAAGGCDSVVTTVLTVNPVPAVPVIVQSSSELSVIPVTGASYQWYWDGLLIPAADSSSYTFTANGLYSVNITNGFGCTSVDTITVSGVSVEDIAGALSITIYPSPTTGEVMIGGIIPETVNILTVQGRLVKTYTQATVISLHDLADGMYLVQLLDSNGVVITNRRVVKLR